MKPFFLIGAERSGTTLLRLMLDSHPLISWLNEFEYSVDILTNSIHWPPTELYIEYLSTHRIFQNSNITIDQTLEYPDLIKSFLVQKQQRDKKPIIGATCHRHYDRLLRIFPKAQFIYLIRDPRDVARSNISIGFAGNIWKGVDRWIEAEKLWDKVKRNIATDSYIEIKYEDLITFPKKSLQKICGFINVSYDKNMLSYPNFTTYSEPNPDLIFQWERKLSEREIQLVESKAYVFMKARGYKTYFNEFPMPSYFLRTFLLAHDKLIRILFRIKQYGIKLVFINFFVRMLHLKSIERKLLLKFNKIQNQHLK